MNKPTHKMSVKEIREYHTSIYEPDGSISIERVHKMAMIIDTLLHRLEYSQEYAKLTNELMDIEEMLEDTQ